MGTLRGLHCWGWSIGLFICFLVVQPLYSIRNEQLEEPHFLRIPEHPQIDENSAYDDDPFIPQKVNKAPVPSVGANCKCGEHDFNDTKINMKDCGKKPWYVSAPEQDHSQSRQLAVNSLVSKGNLTDQSQFPWVVALVERLSNGSAVHFCGGTLISNKLVLTATHCFMKRLINMTEVWLNERDLLLATDGIHTTLKIKAKRLIVHPKFNPIMVYNDIALVELTETVDVQKTYLRPICLPYDESLDKMEYAYTAGWGQTSVTGPKSNRLLHTCLPLLTHKECIDNSLSYFKSRVTKHMICAGDVKKRRTRCMSCGPLFVESGEGANNRYYLVGIVSWGEQCGVPKRPGVYTRVSKYIVWIHEQAELIPDNRLCGF